MILIGGPRDGQFRTVRHRHVDGDDGDVEHDVDVVDDVGVEHGVGDVDVGDDDAENTDGLLDVEHDVVRHRQYARHITPQMHHHKECNRVVFSSVLARAKMA